MGLFSRRLSGEQKQKALVMVRHVQMIMSYQQLSMEIYNNALFSITKQFPQGAEIEPTIVNLPDIKSINEYLVPALDKKIEILESMAKKHGEMSALISSESMQIYLDVTLFIEAALDRAHFMSEVFYQYTNNPKTDLNPTRLDEYELKAMDKYTDSLEELVFDKIGLNMDDFLDINQVACNSVRASLKLLPLDRNTFRSRYMKGISGEIVRFFTDDLPPLK